MNIFREIFWPVVAVLAAFVVGGIIVLLMGATVTNTAWNTSENWTAFQAVAFSTDSDFGTFSDAEQTAIKRIWQRVAEDYAPFNVDVTTEAPASIGMRTAVALITRRSAPMSPPLTGMTIDSPAATLPMLPSYSAVG